MTEDYIFDVDGTLMNVELRVARAKLAKRPEDKVMNWDLFLDPECMLEWDRPNYDVCKIAEVLYDAGEKVIITSIPSIKQAINGKAGTEIIKPEIS